MELLFFHELLNSKENVGEISFRFSDDDETTERYIGYDPNVSDASHPYWAGNSDAPGVRTFKSASDLMSAEIYGKKSLNQRWNDVILREIDGVWPGELNECRKEQMEKIEAKLKKKKKKHLILGISLIPLFIAFAIAIGPVLGQLAILGTFGGLVAVESVTNLFTHSETKNVSDYQSYLDFCSYSEEYMPKIDDLGEYTQVIITKKETVYLIFGTDSVALFAEYDDENYSKAVKEIDEKYDFWSEPSGTIKDFSCSYLGFDYRLVDLKHEDHYYDCKKFMVIGTNSEKNAVSYVFFYDPDIDELGKIENRVSDFVRFPTKYK